MVIAEALGGVAKSCFSPLFITRALPRAATELFVMFRIPPLALLYSLATGAVETVALGALCGLALPSN
jgi:hypothetical protein